MAKTTLYPPVPTPNRLCRAISIHCHPTLRLPLCNLLYRGIPIWTPFCLFRFSFVHWFCCIRSCGWLRLDRKHVGHCLVLPPAVQVTQKPLDVSTVIHPAINCSKTGACQ